MACLPHRKESDEAVENLAKTLSIVDGNVDSDLMSVNLKIAHHMLVCNNGHFPQFDTHGNPSKLFEQLKAKCLGDEKAAILLKSYIYSPKYIETHGNWMVEGKDEPAYADIQPDVERNDLQQLFPNTDVDELSQFLQDQFDALVLNDPAIDQSYFNTPDTIKNDRKKWVDQKLDEEGVSPDNRSKRRMQLEAEYNKHKIDQIFDNMRKQLADAWNIKFGGDGMAINPYKKQDFKRIKGLSYYDVMQFRCNFINTLFSRAHDIRQNELVIQLVRSFLIHPENMDISKLIPPLMQKYIELYKDSQLVIDALSSSGKVKKRSDGTPDKASLERAIGEFIKVATNESVRYSKDRKFETIRSNIESFFAKLTNGVKAALYVYVKHIAQGSKHIIPSAATGITAGLLTGSIGAGVAVAVAMGAVSYASSKQYLENFGENYDAYQKYHIALKNVFIAASLNKELFDFGDYAYPVSVVSEILGTTTGTKLTKALFTLKNNLVRQIKSLSAGSQDNYSSDKQSRQAQIDELNELLRKCNDAISSSKDLQEVKSHDFFQEYIKYASKNLTAAQNKLSSWQNNPELVDPHELIRLKTDVIWAYNSTINGYLIKEWIDRKYKLPGDSGNILSDLIKNELSSQINDAKQLFSSVLDTYVENQISDYLKETVGKTVSKQFYDRFQRNVKKWTANKIMNGTIGVLDRFIVPARDNTSPIIRIAAQRLKEIETIVLEEAGKAGAEIEAVRAESRTFGSRMSFMNPLNRYCERDDEGKFTSNLISDVNIGLYRKDFKAIKSKLIKKWGIELSNNQMLWDEPVKRSYTHTYHDSNGNKVTQTFDSKWQCFQTDLVLWMAGARQDQDGNFVLHEGDIPRVHRRYKYQYYLDKIAILGREGTTTLSSINSEIARIKRSCLTKFTYEVTQKDGTKKTITRNVPIIAKLTEQQRERLKEAEDYKASLSSTVYLQWDENHKFVIGIKSDKDASKLEMAEKFYKWNQKVKQYYTSDQKPSYDLYNAIKSDYETRIQDLRTQGKDFSQLQAEFERFKADSTKHTFSEELTKYFEKKRIVEYDFTNSSVRRYFELKNLIELIRKRLASNNKHRTVDLRKLGVDKASVKSLFKQLKEIDMEMTQLYDNLAVLHQEDVSEEENEGKYPASTFIKNQLLPLLDHDDQELDETFLQHLINEFDMAESDLQYKGTDDKLHWLSILKRPGLKDTVLTLPEFDTIADAYKDIPVGIFAESQSIMFDEEYDDENQDYIQVNKQFERYNNQTEYDKVKNDKLYEKLLEMLDKAWSNYPGLTRKNRYQLPQREASVSDMYGRAVSQFSSKTLKDAWKYMWGNIIDFNTRDQDVYENTLVRSDGTTVENVPTRWLSDIDDANKIDTDLVSSIIDFYTESLRYKYRMRMVPVMEALLFRLNGGEESSPDQGVRHQADLLRSEMNRALYGRDVTGSDVNGRISASEAHIAKVSKLFRSALHKRLMSHNWLSVLKNGLDSFCNLLTQAFMGKYIMTQNIIYGISRLLWDGTGTRVNCINQVIGITRSKATNMTQALMQLNGIQSGIHERFSKQNKWAIRRLLDDFSHIEFESIDYTVKAVVTEAVYDSYRLIWNPNTQQYQYMNENQAEYAYMAAGESREAGYRVWNQAFKCTLRSAYKYDERTGTLSFSNTVNGIKNGVQNELNTIDVIRPLSNLSIADDKRSRILENQIRTEITQITSVVNGMLASEDKNVLAKNYYGAIVTAFRGWMISQSGEYFKNGTDFYNYDEDQDIGVGLSTYFDNAMSLRKPQKVTASAGNRDYEGQYNFATGTIDRGLHTELGSIILSNLGTFGQMMLIFPEYIGDSKTRHLQNSKMSINDFHQLRNAAAATDAMLLVLALACMAYSWYDDDDDAVTQFAREYVQEDYIKSAKALFYTTCIASISERFPSMGKIPFILGGLDLIKALTVGVTMIDDMHYVWDTANNIIDGTQSLFDDDIVQEDNQTFNELINGSFKHRKKWERDVTKAGALFNIDTLPLLLSLDLANNFGMLGDNFEDVKFRDFSHNYYTSTNEQSLKGKAKWYSDVTPVPILNYGMENLNSAYQNYFDSNQSPFRIIKPKGSSESKQAKKSLKF